MKKFIFSVFALFGMTVAASAQSTLTIDDVEAVPGETVTATMKFSIPENTYAGFVFAFQFPSTGFSIDASDENAFVGVKNYEIGTMTEGFVKIAGSTKDTFTASQEFSVQFTVDANVDLDDYPVTVSAELDRDGVLEKIGDDVTFTVKVVSAHSVILDENSTTPPEAASGANVTVRRTIKANEWSTICLPFDMTEEQIKTAFGEGVELAEFVKYEIEEDADERITGIKVVFDPVTTIDANYPFIIKVSSPVTEFTLTGVDVNPQPDDAVAEYTNGKTGSRKEVYGSFVGTYVAGTTLPCEAKNRSLFLSGGNFWYATSATQTMKGYRAYFVFVDELDLVSNARVTMSFEDQTGIEDVTTLTDGQYYDLKGQRVETPSKGIYIKDGKKVVVK